MNRLFKKGISLLLAVTMTLGCSSVVWADEASANNGIASEENITEETGIEVAEPEKTESSSDGISEEDQVEKTETEETTAETEETTAETEETTAETEETIAEENEAEVNSAEENDEKNVSADETTESEEEQTAAETDTPVLNYIFESQTEDGTFVFVSVGNENQSLETATVVYSQSGNESSIVCETKANIAECMLQGEYSLLSLTGTLDGEEFTVSLKELDEEEPVILEETETEEEESSDAVEVLGGEYESYLVQGTFDSEDDVANALELSSNAVSDDADNGEEDLNIEETEAGDESEDDVQVAAAKKIIVIDPGHGKTSSGTWSGCCRTYDGTTVYEDVVVWKIANYLKTILEGYGITVYLTRTESTNPSLEERLIFAKNKGADALVSIHLNANSSSSAHGLMAMTAKIGTYRKSNAQNSQTLANDILNELMKVGFTNNYGLYIREIDDGRTYSDGSTADYYGICRYSQIYNVPAAIIEHGFLSNESDYKTYLNTNAKLKKLAQADANGILKYLGISTTSSSTTVKNGWVTVSGKTYYYKNGKYVTGTPVISGKKYYFDSNGVQQTGWVNLEGMILYFDPSDNGAACIGLSTVEGKKYYFNSDGVRLEGWVTISGKKYYFSKVNDGVMITGNVKIDGYTYRFTSAGVQYFGYYKSPTGNVYYFDPNNNGRAVTGIVTISGKTYGFSGAGVKRFGFSVINGKHYYFDKSTGVMATGIKKINGGIYRFASNGVQTLGFYKTSSGKTYYYDPNNNGRKVTGIVTINKGRYWFDSNGVQQFGYYYEGGKTFYFDPSKNGIKIIGARKIDGKVYLFDKVGALVTGTGFKTVNGKKYYVKNGLLKCSWIKVDGKVYYGDLYKFTLATGAKKIGTKTYLFDENGVLRGGTRIITVGSKIYWLSGGTLQSGWYTSGNVKMYFDPTTYSAAKGFTKIGSKTYYFKSASGVMLKGGVKTISGKKYYFDSNGVQIYGWKTINSHKMYFNKNNKGAAQTGLLRVGTTAYYFDDNGYLTTTKTITDSGSDSSVTVKDPKTGRSFTLESQYMTDPQIGVDVTEEEFFIAAVYAEAGVLDQTGQIATAMVMLNRVENVNYGSSIDLVIYQKTHFTVARNGSLTKYLTAFKNNDQSILKYIDAAGTKTAVQKAKQIMSKYKANGTARTIPGLTAVSGSKDFGCLYFMTPAAFDRLNLDWDKCQAFKYSYKTYNSVFFNYYIKKS